ncbi:Cingulin-like protein 1 [Dissostichus eleginoides]|uniref:Cingulin-like protein 1 n=1 Tax=Dissostichus eleginoides TaxID=100907 RepID=A0AAD9F038_DISEL|nr:Cingulin-like protein 1 [Dissostichus eleginoides]
MKRTKSTKRNRELQTCLHTGLLIKPPDLQRNREDFPASPDNLRELIEDHVLKSRFTEELQGLACEENTERGGLWRFAVLSRDLTFHLQQLQRQTEQELRNIHTQLLQIEGRQQLLTAELFILQQKKKQSEQKLRRSSSLQSATFQLCACRELRSERLVFQQEALSALRQLLTRDQLRYQEETHRLTCFTQRVLRLSHRSYREETFTSRESDRSMQGKTEQENNMHAPSSQSPTSPHQTTNKQEAEQAWRTNYKKPAAGLSRGSNLSRSGSVKNLISIFSGPSSGTQQSFSSGTLPRATSTEALYLSRSKSSPSTLSKVEKDDASVPSITVTPPFRETSQKVAMKGSFNSQIAARIDCPVDVRAEKTASVPMSKTQTKDSGRDSVADSGMGSESELDLNKQPDSPLSEDEPTTPRTVPATQNPKYQLFLNNDYKVNGLSGRDADGPVGGGGTGGENGPRSRFESNRLGQNQYQGSLESLASRDWDNTSDRHGVVDSPPRVFNSPYSTTASMDYNPMHRMSEFKVSGGISPATSEMNLYSFNSRSTSPVGTPTLTRPRFSAYETLVKRRAEVNNHVVRFLSHKQKHTLSKLTMRSNNLGGPNKKDYIEELTKQMDVCQKRNQFLEAESVAMEKERNQIRYEMRGLLVNNEDLLRTNTQLTNEMKRMREQMIEMEREHQSLGERFREMEIEVKQARDVMVEANTQEYAFNFLQQTLKNKIQDAELWVTDRKLEELEVDKETRDKRTTELNSNLFRMETEVSGKLIDREQTLEEEIQLREKIQLQCKQAERAVEDLKMELQTINQAKDDLAKQVKQSHEKMIDLETDLEELHDSEQRWAAKHKRAIEQTEQLQLKLIQEKDLNDLLEMEKGSAERQLREMRLEVEELQSSRVQEDVVSRAESRVKEMENTLRNEERNKSVLTNTISKLERRINELSDQMEEEHRIANEQKDLMTQRMRSLKRQLNEAEEEASRREGQYRHTQRELLEERETSSRLQRQALDQSLQNKRKDTLTIRQTLDNLRLDLSVDDEEEDQPPEEQTTNTVTKV